ncbi:AraC family transcriptional regulator [Paenibacillus whitsoniae]|uniref:AraC family transcriptional regulator n=1 Tax=Paenibacillus whitsoniae TaxID=2496558 RepID=UPI0013E03651|nr:AraC family transcriptional regulator [Paenibacillus whitsoniae]
MLTEEVIKSNNKYIEQARDNVDHTLSNLDNLTYQMSLQPSIRRALYLSEQTWDSDQLLFQENIEYLKSIKLANTLISDLWVQFYRYPVVLNNISKYNSDYYYEDVYKVDSAMNWNERRARHIGFTYMGRQSATSYDIPSSVLTFARTAPLSNLSPTGILYVNVKTEDFSKMIQQGSDPSPAFIFTLDKSGNVVFSNPMRSGQEALFEMMKNELSTKFTSIEASNGQLQEKIGGEPYEIVFTSSLVGDWKYISVVPRSFITQKVNQFRQFTLMAALLCLIVGCIVSYLLTSRIYRPIHQIVEYMNQFGRKDTEGKGKKENELEFINRIMNYVYYENANLRDAFNRNLPALHHKAIDDLLEGSGTSAELNRLSLELGLSFRFDSYQAIAFDIGEFAHTDQGSARIEEMISLVDKPCCEGQLSAMETRTIRKRSDLLVTLLNIDWENPDMGSVYAYIRSVTANLHRVYSPTITVGVGKLYSRAEDISLSYDEALRALQFKIVRGEGSVIFVEEVAGLLIGQPVYSLDMEKRIINLVKTGNVAGWKAQLETLWLHNLNDRRLTPEMIRNLFHALAGTAIRTVYEVNSSMEEIFGNSFDIYKQLDRQSGVQQRITFMEETFGKISEWIQHHKQGQSSHMFIKIKEYVEQNYSQNLSLTVLGDALGLSPSYLSSIFKEITGMNCLDYINSKRIEKAKSILSLTEGTIADISDQVGFTNSNTFIRVFKKYEGVTPGQYRQIHQGTC